MIEPDEVNIAKMANAMANIVGDEVELTYLGKREFRILGPRKRLREMKTVCRFFITQGEHVRSFKIVRENPPELQVELCYKMVEAQYN